MEQTKTNWRAYGLLSFTALCWGANAVFGRLAVNEISPMLLVSLRWFGVLLLLLLFARKHLQRDWRVLRRHLGFLMIMGGVGFTVFNALFYVSAYYTTAVNIGIIQGSIPVFVLIGVFAAYDTRVTPMQLAGVLVTIIGVIVVAFGGELKRITSLAINYGDLLMVLACICYAGYAVGLRRRPRASSLGLFTVIVTAALAASLPLTAYEVLLGQFQWPTPKAWIILSLITVFPSLIAQLFFITGVELIGPSRAGIFVNLVPVFASILAVIFLKEPFALFHAIALCLVLGGIWLSERGKTVESKAIRGT